MAIKEDRYLYEILFRFDENGLVGAHQKYMVKVWDEETGKVWAEGEADPQPVDAEDFETVMAPAMAKLVGQVSELQVAAARAEGRSK